MESTWAKTEDGYTAQSIYNRILKKMAEARPGVFQCCKQHGMVL